MISVRLVRFGKAFKAYSDDEYMGIIYKADFEKLGLDIDAKTLSKESEHEIADDRLDVLKDIVTYHAFDKAVAYAATTECCESDVRFRLRFRDYPDYAIDGTVELMYEYNYIDDRRYAEAYARTYALSKSKSLIIKELEMKDVSFDGMYELIDGVYEDEDISEDKAIEELLRKRFSGQDMNDEKVKRRAMGLLVRHGFSFEKINNHLT